MAKMPAKKLRFEESMNRLSEIVARLEAGKDSLEDSIKLFEEGTVLAGRCYETLKKAEQKVRELSPEQEDEV